MSESLRERLAREDYNRFQPGTDPQVWRTLAEVQAAEAAAGPNE